MDDKVDDQVDDKVDDEVDDKGYDDEPEPVHPGVRHRDRGW